MSSGFRWVAPCAALVLGVAAAPIALAADSSPTFQVDLTASYLQGDYDADEETEFYSFAPRFRLLLPRGEVRVSVPYLWLRSDGEIVLVGGTPVPRPGNRNPPVVPGPGPGPPGMPPSDPSVTEETSVAGLGDIVVQGDLDLLTGSAKRPWVIGTVRVKLSTADETEGLGTGQSDQEVGFDLVQDLGRTRILASAGHTWMGDPSGFDLENVIRLGAGVWQRLPGASQTQIFAYLENRTHPVVGLDDRLDLSLGASSRLGGQRRVRLSASVFVGLSGTTEDLGASFTLGRQF